MKEIPSSQKKEELLCLKGLLYKYKNYLAGILFGKKKNTVEETQEDIFRVFYPQELKILGYMDVSKYSRPHVHGKIKTKQNLVTGQKINHKTFQKGNSFGEEVDQGVENIVEETGIVESFLQTEADQGIKEIENADSFSKEPPFQQTKAEKRKQRRALAQEKRNSSTKHLRTLGENLDNTSLENLKTIINSEE